VEASERHFAKRELVAEATWAVIGRVGLSGASLREIAREAGCTTGVLMHYFRNKDELLLFVFSHAMRTVADRMEVVASAPGAPMDRLLAVLGEALPMDEERRMEALIYFGFVEAAMRDENLAVEFGKRYSDWSHRVSVLVADVLGTRASKASAATADLLLAVVDGIAIGAVAHPGNYPAKRQAQLLRNAVTALVQEQG
jgi:AcrR family transcriptional regulator